MDLTTLTHRLGRTAIVLAGLWIIPAPTIGWSLDAADPAPAERRESLSLADAAIRALQHNLDISISRHTKESRVADIVIEQAKFDPTISLNGQYNRTASPLNRPVFGGTGGTLNNITTFDQRNHSATVDLTQNLITGGNVDINYSPSRTNVNQDVARGFLFNPSWTDRKSVV
jgi:outer membrane protein TolC